MNKLKSILAVLLLLAVTAAIIFLPQIINEHHNNSLLKRHKTWTHTGRTAVGITAKQVATLYCEGELDNIYSESLAFDSNNAEREELKAIASSVIVDIFGCGSVTADFVNAELEKDPVTELSRRSVLAIIDGHAVVLNLVAVSSRRLYFVFEEKTGAVISFSFFSVNETLSDAAQVEEKIINDAIAGYYEKLLSGTSYLHYYFNRSELGDEESEKYDFCFTDFGLLKAEKEYDGTYIF